MQRQGLINLIKDLQMQLEEKQGRLLLIMIGLNLKLKDLMTPFLNGLDKGS